MNCHKCATPVPDNSKFCLSCGADLSGESAERTLAIEENDPELRARLQAELGDEYIIEKELGRGGMAIVFLAHDAHLGRKVAVKLLPPELTFSSSSGLIERFKREARTAATLDHPHIIPVHRVSTGGKLFWYVMKFLQGESLDAILKREGQLALDRTLGIVSQVAEALDYAHQNNVVHRDIKPANVMVDAKGWCTVTDFGIAKALDANTMTGSGSMIGTPYYMSPEQCSGKKVTGASDQYSLGVMTFQMLGGHLPFTGESVVDIVRKHVMDPVPPLGVLRPNLPEALVAAVERALAKPPDARFPSVTEYARALHAAAQGLDITLTPPIKIGRPRGSETALVSPVPGVLRTAKGSWGKRLAIAGAVGGTLGVAGIALILWQGPDTASPRVAVQPGAEPVAARPADSAGAARADSAPSAPPPGAADTVAAASPPAPVAERPARLTLRGVPAGATVTINGRTIRGNTADLEPGRRYTIQVVQAGFEPWEQVVRPRAGEALNFPVALRPIAQAAPPAAPPAGAAPAPAQPAGAAAQPSPATAAWISIGSSPLSAMVIQGRPAPTNPVRNFEVRPGRVPVRFQVTDSLGPWSVDTAFTIQPGETLNARRIQLRRP
jgi:serine/threonine-protein kinase